MNAYLISHIRTYAPIVAGVLVTWLASFGIDIDTPTITAAFLSISSALYYGIVRAAAIKIPAVGILLGVNNAPTYAD